jgi:hypothetical protein
VNHSQDDPILEEATRRLVKEFSPSKVYLFGSRSRGDATRDSDYDFLVIVASSDERPLRRAQKGIPGSSGSGYRQRRHRDHFCALRPDEDSEGLA